MRTLSTALRFNSDPYGGMSDAGGKREAGGSSGGGNTGGRDNGNDNNNEGVRSAEAQAKDREIQNDARQQEKDKEGARDRLTTALKPAVVPGAIIRTLTAPFRPLPGATELIDAAAKRANAALDAARKASVERQVKELYGGGSGNTQRPSQPSRETQDRGSGNENRQSAVLYQSPAQTMSFTAPKTIVNPVPSVGYYPSQVFSYAPQVRRPQTGTFPLDNIDNKTMLYLAAGGVALIALLALTSAD